MSQLHDGDEKKDPENGEKDDITYADLDSNALTSGMTEFVFNGNSSMPILWL